MDDQNAGTANPDTSMNTEKQTVIDNRDRARAESAARTAQPRPSSSGQLNPGAEEDHAVRPSGPAGTDSTTSNARGTHPDRTRIEE